MFSMRDVESCEDLEPRAIAFERHESGILRDKSFDSIGEKMDIQTIGKTFVSASVNGMFGPYKLVGPEQNAHGLILRTLSLSGGTVVLSATPPVDNYDTSKVIAFSTTGRTEPFLVPAGLGVYIKLANTYNQVINVTFDYLNADGTVA